jgi:hypothetical protein
MTKTIPLKLRQLLIVMLAVSENVFAQLPYTQPIYAYRVEQNIQYGSAINYAGNEVDLFLDLYKPIGDNNPNRPVLIIAFGGAWIGGSRTSTDVMPLIPWFVRRGYVVASVDYRLGIHTSPSGGSNTATCSAMDGPTNCVYAVDTSEFIRASYRAMQDIKGAIRFLKARSLTDSTCKENFYLSGVSAGGFNAIAAAFVDEEAEKPASAAALSDAPTGANSLSYCHQYHNQPGAEIKRQRPDLGSIEGTIALNGENSKVKGVANFFGGMIWNFMANSKAGDAPLLYLYHKTSDLVVSCGKTPLLSSLSYNCLDPFGFLGCKHIWHTPWAWGSCAIKTLIDAESYPINYYNSIVNNGGPNCLESPSGHSYQGPEQRAAEIATYFAPRIVETEQAGCAVVTFQKQPDPEILIRVYPNPVSGILKIKSSVALRDMYLSDLSGRTLMKPEPTQTEIDLSNLQEGIYMLNYNSAFGSGVLRIVKSNP